LSPEKLINSPTCPPQRGGKIELKKRSSFSKINPLIYLPFGEERRGLYQCYIYL